MNTSLIESTLTSTKTRFGCRVRSASATYEIVEPTKEASDKVEDIFYKGEAVSIGGPDYYLVTINTHIPSEGPRSIEIAFTAVGHGVIPRADAVQDWLTSL